MAPESLNALFWRLRACGLVCGRPGGSVAAANAQLCCWGGGASSSLSASSVSARMANWFCKEKMVVGVIGEAGKHRFLMLTLSSTSNAPPRQACSGVGFVGMMVL